MRPLTFVAGIIVGTAFASFVAFAWTGPTAAPPNNNVPAPVNVGTVDQIKNAGLGLNSLAVFGNAIISTVNGYLNFGSTVGSSGYGIRDNAGTMEFKNNSGQWRAIMGTLNGAAGPVSSIQFSDGTTQTTAGVGGTIFTCPTGFTKITSQGRTLGCVQNTERGHNSWETAVNDCFVTYGATLPTSAEYFLAAKNFLGTDMQASGDEWIDDIVIYPQVSYNMHVYLHYNGSTIDTSFNYNSDTSRGYRCWIPAGA